LERYAARRQPYVDRDFFRLRKLRFSAGCRRSVGSRGLDGRSFSALNLKLVSSIVAISAIALLRAL
jgi:hypothetical protein